MTPDARQALRARAEALEPKLRQRADLLDARWLSLGVSLAMDCVTAMRDARDLTADLLAALDAQEQETQALAEAIWPDHGGKHVTTLAILAMAHRLDSLDLAPAMAEAARYKALLVEGHGRRMTHEIECNVWSPRESVAEGRYVECSCGAADYRRRVEEAVT